MVPFIMMQSKRTVIADASVSIENISRMGESSNSGDSAFGYDGTPRRNAAILPYWFVTALASPRAYAYNIWYRA